MIEELIYLAVNTPVNSIPQILSYTFILPFFWMGFELLVFGVLWMASKRFVIGVMGSFIGSLVLYFISHQLIPTWFIAFSGSVTFVIVLVDLYLESRKHK